MNAVCDSSGFCQFLQPNLDRHPLLLQRASTARRSRSDADRRPGRGSASKTSGSSTSARAWKPAADMAMRRMHRRKTASARTTRSCSTSTPTSSRPSKVRRRGTAGALRGNAPAGSSFEDQGPSGPSLDICRAVREQSPARAAVIGGQASVIPARLRRLGSAVRVIVASQAHRSREPQTVMVRDVRMKRLRRTGRRRGSRRLASLERETAPLAAEVVLAARVRRTRARRGRSLRPSTCRASRARRWMVMRCAVRTASALPTTTRSRSRSIGLSLPGASPSAAEVETRARPCAS